MDLKRLAKIPPWDWPNDEARDSLLRVLTDPAAPAGERHLAAELAGNVGVMDDELAEVLLRIIGDAGEPEELRGSAAIALGPALEELWMEDVPDPYDATPVTAPVGKRIREALHAIYRDPAVPRLVRRRALEASVRFGEGWHTGAVRAAYYDDDPEWTLTAVFAMRFVNDSGGDDFETEIREALHHTDDAVRCQAILAAGVSAFEWAIPEVRRVLATESDSDLLLAAIDSIGHLLFDPDALWDSVGHLVDSRDPEVSEAAHDLLTLAEATRENPEGEGPHDGIWH